MIAKVEERQADSFVEVPPSMLESLPLQVL